MKQSSYQHHVVQKCLMTLVILLIYLFGLKIPLVVSEIPTSSQQPITTLKMVASFTGGNLNHASIFSLGLAPWMSGLIIWRALQTIKWLSIEKMSPKKVSVRQLLLTLIIAIIQAIGVMVTFLNQSHLQTTDYLTAVVLVGGAFFLIWLGNMNSVYGVGGSTVLVLSSILYNIYQQHQQYLVDFNQFLTWQKLTFIGLLVIALIINVTIDRAELRLPVQRILLDTKSMRKAYIAIKLNPAGGMPIMYAMAVMALPQYLCLGLLLLFPQNEWLLFIRENLRLQTLLGVMTYNIILFLLSIGFSFITIEPDKLARQLRHSGDFFANIAPGEPTRKYLQSIMLKVAFFGAITTVLVAGLPLFLGIGQDQHLRILMLPGVGFILVGLLATVDEQLSALAIKRRYRSLL